jgi:hypothetical protein
MKASNQSMKPTAPKQNNLGALADLPSYYRLLSFYARTREGNSRSQRPKKAALQPGQTPHSHCFFSGMSHFPFAARDTETLQLSRRWPEPDLCE